VLLFYQVALRLPSLYLDPEEESGQRLEHGLARGRAAQRTFPLDAPPPDAARAALVHKPERHHQHTREEAHLVWGLGFGVWGLGFGVYGLGFRV